MRTEWKSKLEEIAESSLRCAENVSAAHPTRRAALKEFRLAVSLLERIDSEPVVGRILGSYAAPKAPEGGS